MRRIARQLRRLGVTVDTLVSSPLARAIQTAEIVAQVLKLEPGLVIDQRLAPGFALPQLRAVLAEHASRDTLMLVGHEPDLSTVIGRLIGAGRVVCKKGGVARVDLVSPTALQGDLVWLLPPRVLAG